MKTKYVTYDIPAPLDDILAIYADSIDDDANTIITDSLARLTQYTLTILAMQHPDYIPHLHAIHTLRRHPLTKPSPVETVLLNLTLHTHHTYHLPEFVLYPCRRTRGYLRVSDKLLTLANTARQTAPMNTFISRALFEGLEYRLTLEGTLAMNQEYIPAATTQEYHHLLAELRDLKRRITNMEMMQTPPDGTAELLTQLLLSLTHEATESIATKGGTHEKAD